MSLLMALGVGIGFGRTYTARIAAGTTTPLIHIHGAVFGTWMLLFIAQAGLVATGRTRLHRQIGVAGGFLAALMLAIGPVVAVIATRHGGPPNPTGDPAVSQIFANSFLLFGPLRDILVFGSLTGAAIVLNRDVETHKRLMLMGTLGGLGPAGFVRLARGPLGFAIVIVLMISGPVYDWVMHKRFYAAYGWGIAVNLLTFAVFALLAQTAAWQSFAKTLID